MLSKVCATIGSAVDVVFPNRFLALVGLSGFTIETTLQSISRSSVFSGDFVLDAFAFTALLSLWVIATWCIYGLARAAEAIGDRHGSRWRTLFQVASGAGLTLVAIGFIGSWLMQLQIGRFATVDVYLFLWANPFLSMWDHMGMGERRGVIAAAIGFPIATLMCVLMMRRTTQKMWTDLRARNARASWALLALLLALAWQPIAGDLSQHRTAARLDAIRTRLHPSVTWATSSIDMVRQSPIQPILDVAQLRSQDGSNWRPSSEGPHPSVIFLAVESLRSDIVGMKHQGMEVAPNLNRLAAEGLEWQRSYAQSTHSDYADVCIVSSLYPLRTHRHHYYRSDDPWPKTLAFDLFKTAGYSTAVFSSQNESWGGMDQFLQVPSLDLFFDAARSNLPTHTSWRDPGFACERALGTFHAGSLRDNDTMDHTIKWINAQASAGKPYYISMNLQSSHFPYELPEQADQPFQPARLDKDVTFMYHPPEKTPLVRNCYLNAIRYCDVQIGRLVNHLRENDLLNDTIIIVLGENGEAFHENGSVGHAREPVEPAVNVATVMYGPKYFKAGKSDYPLEHVDLMPTLLGVMGWESHPNFQGINLLSEDRPRLDQRLIFHHVNSGASRSDGVQWAGRWKLIVDRDTGRGTLFDLKMDPEESRDLSENYPVTGAVLRETLEKWRAMQLSYHRYPMYYRNYYPPSAPQLTDAQVEAMKRELQRVDEGV